MGKIKASRHIMARYMLQDTFKGVDIGSYICPGVVISFNTYPGLDIWFNIHIPKGRYRF